MRGMWYAPDSPVERPDRLSAELAAVPTARVTQTPEYGPISVDRAVLTLTREDMRHPPHVWVDPSYAKESLERLRGDYLTYLRGRAQTVSGETITQYSKVLLSFSRSLERHGDQPILAALTPAAVNRWVNDQ